MRPPRHRNASCAGWRSTDGIGGTRATSDAASEAAMSQAETAAGNAGIPRVGRTPSGLEFRRRRAWTALVASGTRGTGGVRLKTFVSGNTTPWRTTHLHSILQGTPGPQDAPQASKGVVCGCLPIHCLSCPQSHPRASHGHGLQTVHDAPQPHPTSDRPSHHPARVPTRRPSIRPHIRRCGRWPMDMQRNDGSCPVTHPGGSHGHYPDTIPGRRPAARLDGPTSQDAP